MGDTFSAGMARNGRPVVDGEVIIRNDVPADGDALQACLREVGFLK